MAADNEGQARFQYTRCPRWIEFSGIAGAWGLRNSAPPRIYLALIRWDHMLQGMSDRRHGHELRTFAVPNEDVAQMAGVYPDSVGKIAKQLLAAGLLEGYKHGSGKAWSHFQINRGPLLELYRYVAPRLRMMHGGVWNVEPGSKAARKALGTTQIYGGVTDPPSLPEPLTIDEIGMLKLWQQRPAKPEWPDPREVARILGI